MRIVKIELEKVRGFIEKTSFDLSESSAINVISGLNGSGKTTLFKCLHMCQKVFFFDQISDSNNRLYSQIREELSKVLNSSKSTIQVDFVIDGVDHFMKLQCTSHSANTVSFDEVYSKNGRQKIKEYWNINNPKHLIIFIPSDKHFEEGDVFHNNIKITSLTSYKEFITQAIYNPGLLFRNIYTTLMSDYISERLVPSRPRKDLYFLVTKTLFKYLLPNVELSNFSGQHTPNQFVLLGKSGNGRGNVNFYDVRNFSSGEKVLFNILLFINYIRQVGVLIIDEPENHFHEDLLVQVVAFLNEVTKATSYADFIRDIEDRLSISTVEKRRSRYDDYFKNFNLSQVYLLSHSKNLIYHNFSIGKNYYVDNGLTPIRFEGYEETLRAIGVSSIFSRVLFVEGVTEESFLEYFLSDYGITVHNLESKNNVVDTFRKIVSIQNYTANARFGFLVDSDSMSDDEINAIRQVSPSYFDKAFKILERHEFENYLLDSNIFKDIYNDHKGLFIEMKDISIAEIEILIKEIADTTRDISIRKELNKLNHYTLSRLKEKFVTRNVPVSSELKYTEFVRDEFKNFNAELHLKNEFFANYQTVMNKYSDENWNRDWIKLCDGKIVLGKVLGVFSRKLGITVPRLRSEIKTYVLASESTELKSVIWGITQSLE